jgi:hypothetical protein
MNYRRTRVNRHARRQSSATALRVHSLALAQARRPFFESSVRTSYGPAVDAEAEAVRQALTALDEAFERRDLEAVMDLCTRDVVFIGSGE